MTRPPSVTRGATAWAGAAGAQARIARGLEILRRQGVDVPALAEVAAAVAERAVRRHEQRLRSAQRRLERAVGRLMDDLQVLESTGAPRRPDTERAADLEAVAQSLRDITTLQDALGRRPEDASAFASGLRSLLEAAGTPGRPAVAAAGTGAVRSLDDSLRVGRNSVEHAQDVVDAWRSGRTLEHPGVAAVPVRWPDHPLLVEQMERMAAAVREYQQTGRHLTDPAAAARAADDLQRLVAETSDVLRAAGDRFDVVARGDVPVPTAPVPAGVVPPPPGSRAEAAVRARTAVAALPPTASPAQLVDALEFSRPEVRASGALGEPLDRSLPGMGLEAHTHGADHIRRYRTRPPWLAARLADLVQGWERAHLVGPGFGGELSLGLMLAPWGVNQVAQNRGIEEVLRSMADVARSSGGPEVRTVVTASGRRLAVPLANGGFEHVDVLTRVRYELPGATPPRWYQIDVGLDGSWRVTHDLPGWPADVPLSGTR